MEEAKEKEMMQQHPRMGRGDEPNWRHGKNECSDKKSRDIKREREKFDRTKVVGILSRHRVRETWPYPETPAP